MYKAVLMIAAVCPAGWAMTPQSRVMAPAQPLRFEPNRGQDASAALFVSGGANRMVRLMERGVEVTLGERRVWMELVNGNPHPAVRGEETAGARTDYRRGNERGKWQVGVPHYGAVRYAAVYPKIDLVFHGRRQELEYDFELAPGADAGQIKLRFVGADRVRVAASGELLVEAGKGVLTQPVPYAYQETAAGRKAVVARYRVVGASEVVFEVGDYERERRLVIDPVLRATYLGGTNTDIATAVTYDGQGGLWVAGYTASVDFPVTGPPFAETKNTNNDVFVAHYAPDGQLDYVTYLGGDNDDRATAIAADTAGNIYITGYTASTNFPLGGGSYQNNNAGQRDIFLTQLNLALRGLDSLWYSTYLGGTANDVANAIAIAPDGTLYIAGYTNSGEFPLLGNSAQTGNRGGFDAFLAQLDPRLTTESVRYTTYLGGSSTDVATGVAVGPNNRVYLAGYTMSEDFPVEGASVQPNYGGRGDAFLAEFDRNRSGLDAFVYGTYLGGTDTELAYGLRRAPAGELYLTGYTLSVDFPVTAGAVQRQKSGDSDAFLSRIDLRQAGGAQLTYSTYLGGNTMDIGYGLAVDAGGRVAVSGYTFSTDFPRTANAQQSAMGGAYDAFLTVVNPAAAGSAGLVYSTYLGGAATEVGYQVAFDNLGNVAMVGFSTSPEGIIAGTAPVQPELAGFADGFVARYNLCDIPGICAP
jgi:hypothetical protein